MECIDSGKPFGEAEWDIDDVASCFDYCALPALRLRGSASVLTSCVPCQTLNLLESWTQRPRSPWMSGTVTTRPVRTHAHRVR